MTANLPTQDSADEFLDEIIAEYKSDTFTGYYAYKNKPIKFNEYQVGIDKRCKAKINQLFDTKNSPIKEELSALGKHTSKADTTSISDDLDTALDELFATHSGMTPHTQNSARAIIKYLIGERERLTRIEALQWALNDYNMQDTDTKENLEGYIKEQLSTQSVKGDES